MDIRPFYANDCLKGRPQCNLHSRGAIAVKCSPTCELDHWTTSPATEVQGRLPCRITDRTGARLTDENGDITPAARKAGLGLVIGLGPEEPDLAFFRRVRRQSRPGLRRPHHYLARRPASGADWARQPSPDLQLREKPGPCGSHRHGRRRSSRTDSRRGQRAKQSRTSPFHLWDAQASLVGKPEGNNLMRRYGWREGDAENMPGSAFKLFTAVAAIDSAEHGNTAIQSYIAGRPAKDVYSYLEIKSDAPPVSCHNERGDGSETSVIPDRDPKRSYCIHNNEGESLTTAENVWKLCDTQQGNINICGALAISSNIWFGKVASLVDENRLMQGSSGEERTDAVRDLELRRAVQRLTQQNSKASQSLLIYWNNYQPLSLFLQPVQIEAENPTRTGDRRELLALPRLRPERNCVAADPCGGLCQCRLRRRQPPPS